MAGGPPSEHLPAGVILDAALLVDQQPVAGTQLIRPLELATERIEEHAVRIKIIGCAAADVAWVRRYKYSCRLRGKNLTCPLDESEHLRVLAGEMFVSQALASKLLRGLTFLTHEVSRPPGIEDEPSDHEKRAQCQRRRYSKRARAPSLDQHDGCAS